MQPQSPIAFPPLNASHLTTNCFFVLDSNSCGQPFSGVVCALEHIAIGLIFYIGITLILLLIYFGLKKAGYVPPVEITFQKPGNRSLLDDSPQNSMSTR
jgi:hypothetical protein